MSSLDWLTGPGRRLAYSVGFTITEDMQDATLKVPARAWTPAYDAEGQVRPGAWAAEITGMLDLSSWPKGMRVIVRKNARTRVPSCASPTSAATGSPALPPARKAASLPIWNCATAAGPGARTASARLRTPACATFPCTATPRTRSGVRSSPWPANCWPGCRCSPSPAKPAAGGGRRLRLRITATWPWATQITAAINRLHALAPG